MGKKKQAQRTKNNVVPASSGRSAELLQTSSSVPFVSFSTLKEGGFIPILSGIGDELDLNINEDFRLVWKKMNKKDTTTKLKALDEFKKLCQDSDVEALKPVLPYWPRLFSTLATDEEHRVREAAHTAHRALVSKAGRNIAPYLKQLVGPWFTGQHDTYPPAASTAEISFQETFPPNKLVEAIVFCQEEILNYICNNLLNHTPQTLTNNQNCSQEVKDARYQRVVVSCLNGYALYLHRLPVEHLRRAEEANLKLVSSAKFWKFNKDSAPIVRAAWFTALVALCEKAPFLLAQETKHVCMAVFTNIDETDSAVVTSVWQAALLTFQVVEDVWKHVSWEKLVLPKLYKVLKEGADGNASLVFPNLLPLLSKVPSDLVTEKTNFYSKFFENLRIGLKVRNVQISAKETSAVITALLECLRYLISTKSSEENLCLSLFEEQIIPLVEVVLSDTKLQLARPCLFSGMTSLVNFWSKQSSSLYLSLTSTFWSRLISICHKLLEINITDCSALANNCSAIEALIVAFKKSTFFSKKSCKVSFVSPRKGKDEEDSEQLSPVLEESFAPSFEEGRIKLVKEHLTLCFNLLRTSSDRAKVVLIGHIARVVEEYDNLYVFNHILSINKLTWAKFYQQELARWLRDESIPLDYTLQIIFNLLKYVEDKNDLNHVYSDLSGEVSSKENDSESQLLPVKWQEVLQWALKSEHQTPCVKQWVASHGGVCRLASLLRREDPSYNILHNCLRNLRQSNWLTVDSLGELIRSLRRNLIDESVSGDVKICSADLLHAMMQNTANHTILAKLPNELLSSLLYELFTANLQKLPYFPQNWQHCLAILSLKTSGDITLEAVCNTCVDIMIAVIRTRPMDLVENQQLVSVLEDLIYAASGNQTDMESFGSMLGIIISRLIARVRVDAECIWCLCAAAETVNGTLPDNSLPNREFVSQISKDPLACVCLEQYVTSMIPLLIMVVKLQTASQTEDCDARFPYAQLRSTLSTDDLWEWSLEVLQLHSLCISFKTHFSSTKQYFVLKDKITFVLEECGLFSQLRVKDLIKKLDLSMFQESSCSLQKCDHFLKLQKQVVLRDLFLLYDIQQIQNYLLPLKSKSDIVKQYYFPEEVLEDLATSETLDREKLTVVNSCCRRLTRLRNNTNDAELVQNCTNISILDKIFDQYVSEMKEDKSLLDLPDCELRHIAETVEFVQFSVIHDSVHMKQSSWDACLVATAALTHSINSTLTEWKSRLSPSPLSAEIVEPPDIPPGEVWPLNLLSQCAQSSASHGEEKGLLHLQLVRVLCSVCRLFDSVSAYMSSMDVSDKEAMRRRDEWTEVFLPDTHSALTQAWLTITDTPSDRPLVFLLVEALSSSIAHHVQYPHFVNNNDTLACLDVCCRLLQLSETSVQLAAYNLLLKLIPAMIKLDVEESEKDNVALSCQHVDKTLVYTQSIINVILSGLSFGDLCIVEPFTDSYTYTRCYLLLWSALLEMCSNASSELRALYTTWLKEEYLAVFMKTVFCLMPEAALHGEVPSQRIGHLFSKPPQFDKGVWSSERLAHLSCWVFACSLRRLPAAIRQWWNEADHRIYSLVEHVTATYVSPDLCAEEMRSIQMQEKKFDNMTVHVHPTTKEVYAVYTVEESRMELVIELAHNHPLGLVKVRSGQRMVSTTQTRQWLLQITIFLTHQNGSIWDALELWKNSLDKRFEGVEECYICFAILHTVSHQLPKLSCKTCRKKFHSHCLYKWFTTSNKSTCPICRNQF